MQKPQRSTYSIILAVFIVTGLYASFVSTSSADVISLLSGVFNNASVGSIPEIEQVRVKNLQTMPLLAASINPTAQDTSASSSEVTGDLQATSLVDGKALTNENSSVTNGPAGVHEKDPTYSDRISIYTVRKGDTLEQVAKMYNVSPSTILWANDMKKGSVLKPDQVITILPISGIKYTVKKGDTLASVAKKYKSDTDEIASFNNLDNSAVLAIGDEIIIPDAEGDTQTDNTSTKSTKDTKKGGAKGGKKFAQGGNAGSHMVDPAGYLTRPINGGIRTQGIHGHNGVDLASSYGTPILAAASGQVLVVKTGGWDGGYGNYAVIQHPNGLQTLYGHMSTVLVSVGQHVDQGQQIGKMGNTGESTGVHLHFEVRGGKNPF